MQMQATGRACSGSGLRIGVWHSAGHTHQAGCQYYRTYCYSGLRLWWGLCHAQACYSFMGGRSARIEKAKHIAGPDSERPVFATLDLLDSPEMCVYGLKSFAGGGDRPPQHVCSLLEHAHARTVVCRCVVLALRQEEIRIIVKTERRTCSPTRQSTAAPSAFFLPLEPEALGVGFTLVPQIQPAGLLADALSRMCAHSTSDGFDLRAVWAYWVGLGPRLFGERGLEGELIRGASSVRLHCIIGGVSGHVQDRCHD